VSKGTEPSLQASTNSIASPSYPILLGILQESTCRTINVPEQKAIKSVSVPQFAITPISLYIPPLGLSQSITGDPSHLTLVGVSLLPQVKSGGVIGLIAFPELGTVPQLRGSLLKELLLASPLEELLPAQD
jgi:hypothetical protein